MRVVSIQDVGRFLFVNWHLLSQLAGLRNVLRSQAVLALATRRSGSGYSPRPPLSSRI
jgi:hypothetical protein